jgi:hemoglobin
MLRSTLKLAQPLGTVGGRAFSASIYDKIGGTKSVKAAVDIFYGKVLADPVVNGFFVNTNMEAQRAKQVKFLSFVMGSPEKWQGKNMLEAHRGMKITDEHFGAIAGHLQSTLVELKVPEDIINDIMTVAASTHDDIVHPDGVTRDA